jgi:hypothetical protein
MDENRVASSAAFFVYRWMFRDSASDADSLRAGRRKLRTS